MLLSWDLFNNMTGYQCIGWGKGIKPEHRSYSTLSDGAIFSNRETAVKYAKTYMSHAEIKEIPNATPETVEFWDRRFS